MYGNLCVQAAKRLKGERRDRAIERYPAARPPVLGDACLIFTCLPCEQGLLWLIPPYTSAVPEAEP